MREREKEYEETKRVNVASYILILAVCPTRFISIKNMKGRKGVGERKKKKERKRRREKEREKEYEKTKRVNVASYILIIAVWFPWSQ